MYGKSTLAIVSALIALVFIAGIAAPNSAMAARDQWVPEFKSPKAAKAPKAVRTQRDDDDNAADATQDDTDDADDGNENELPEWADDAF